MTYRDLARALVRSTWLAFPRTDDRQSLERLSLATAALPVLLHLVVMVAYQLPGVSKAVNGAAFLVAAGVWMMLFVAAIRRKLGAQLGAVTFTLGSLAWCTAVSTAPMTHLLPSVTLALFTAMLGGIAVAVTLERESASAPAPTSGS